MSVELSEENSDSERGVERLLVTLRDGDYVVESIPWYARNLDRGDTVEVTIDETGEYRFIGVVRRGGHTTYHVRVDAENTNADLPEIVAELREEIHGIGAMIEENGPDFFSVDVAPNLDGSLVLKVLADAQTAGIIDFEGSDSSAAQY